MHGKEKDLTANCNLHEGQESKLQKNKIEKEMTMIVDCYAIVHPRAVAEICQ